MAGVYLDEASEKQRIFHNYLIQHSIFMTEELREKFGAVDRALSTALTSYSVGTDAGDWELIRSGQEVNHLKNMVDEVEQAVQQRLHYDEA
jgi:hypothetical protein